MLGVFDIVGPVMIGPSSSHTAGAVRLGRMALAVLASKPVKGELILHGSFAKTGKGHGTDLALIAGILGMGPDDENIVNGRQIAAQEGLEISITTGDLGFVHPNTAKIILQNQEGIRVAVTGSSVGGGNIVVNRINHFDVHLTGEHYTLCAAYDDQLGMIAEVSKLLASEAINIANMRVSREDRKNRALMVVETDNMIPKETLLAIHSLKEIDTVFVLKPVID